MLLSFIYFRKNIRIHKILVSEVESFCFKPKMLVLVLGLFCHLWTGSWLCGGPDSIAKEAVQLNNGLSKILDKELANTHVPSMRSLFQTGLEAVEAEFTNHMQGDNPGQAEDIEEWLSYRPTDYEVLLCSWCTASGDIFLWTANTVKPEVPGGTSCESISDLTEEMKTGNSSLLAVGYASRTFGCYNTLSLNLFHLNQTEIPKGLIDTYGRGFDLLEEVNWSLTWEPTVEVIPLERHGSVEHSNHIEP